nr:helix-turn-helix transcriptional regulator [Mesorhizobium soli]
MFSDIREHGEWFLATDEVRSFIVDRAIQIDIGKRKKDGGQLAEHLSATGTTDAALAAKVGCDRSMITKIRAGKATPSLPLALAITRETGVPVEALLPAGAAA